MHRLTLKNGQKMEFKDKQHCDCYSDNNRNACIRGIDGKSQDLRSFIKELWVKLVNPNEVFPDDDEEFDDFLDIELQDDSSVSGLIAYLYQQMYTKANLYEALKEYENMEESGQLVKEEVTEVEITGENVAIGCKIGACKCGQMLRDYEKYCSECGRKLLWLTS